MFADSLRPGRTPDVFLSYRSADAEVVREVCRLLEARGLTTFLDRKDLVAGLPWPEKLEGGLSRAGAVAAFLGPSGLGGWQRKEMYFALDRQVAEEKAGREFPVIPVLLPGADPALGFASLNTWVDLRYDPRSPEALDALVRAVRGEAPTLATEDAKVVCPYRGLRSFRAEDAPFFCGREVFSRRLFEAVSAQPFVAVVGASGSGKSSVVAAGLLPLLYRQRPPTATWDAIVFRPRRQPFYELASALLRFADPDLPFDQLDARAQPLADRLARGETRLENLTDQVLSATGGTDRLLLVVDQLEELFTLAPEGERQPFLEALLGAAGRALRVAVTLRSDFYGQVLEASRELSDRLASGGLVNLGPMTSEEVRQAVEEPARRVGLRFQDGLAERILRGLGNEPGRLPLLEFALTELFATRRKREITHAGYESFGGVEGAIGRRAETEFAELTAEERAAAKRLFVAHLVRVSPPEEGAKDTRQPARLRDLDEASRRVVGKFSQEWVRLLVTGRDEATGEEIVELAHEALLRQWPTLREWVDEDREFLLWRRRLEVRIAEWEGSSEAEEVLLAGPPLTEAERWLSERVEDFTRRQRRFVEASLAAEQGRERRRQARSYVAAGLAVVFLLLAGVATWAWRDARAHERRIWAASVVASAQSVAASQPVVAALLLIELGTTRVAEIPGALPLASRLVRQPLPQVGLDGEVAAFSPDGQRIVIASRDATAQVWRSDGTGGPVFLSGHEDRIRSAVFSPDGNRILTASWDGTARLWNTDGTGNPVIFEGHAGPIWSATFSPDGDRIVTASVDGTARVWNADGVGEPIVLEHGFFPTTATFSPDGQRILTASGDGTVRLWTADGTSKSTLAINTPSPLRAAAFSPDGQRLLTAFWTGTVWLWNTDGTSEFIALENGPFLIIAAFSPNGQRVLTAFEDGTVRLENADGSGESVTFRGHKGRISSAAFSPDGQRILTASQDGTARLWNANGSGETVVLRAHEWPVSSAAFSPDSQRIVTVSQDGTVLLWNPDRTLPVILEGHEDSVESAMFSPDGRSILTASWDGTVRLWNADGTSERVVLTDSDWPVLSAAFSPDGQRILETSLSGIVRLWNINNTGEALELEVHEDSVNGAMFSPDGQRFVTASHDGTARIWSTGGSPEPVVLEGHEGPVESAAFSPDGQRIITASDDGTARIWSVDGSPKRVLLEGHEESVKSATFSPDGRYILTASADGTVRIWNGNGIGQPMPPRGHAGPVRDGAFSLDGRRVVTATEHGTARVWHLHGADEPVVLEGHRGPVNSAAFSPDGQLVVTASEDGTARVWRVGWEALAEHLRNATTICLTPTQRERYLIETAHEAEERYQECERSHGRTPR